MGDELDTMNMFAEKENDSDLSSWADMAPPPSKPHWNEIPPPPTPPPCRLECSSCGYIAPEPEFRKNHPYCRTGRFLIIILSIALVTLTMLPLLAMYVNINS